MMMKGIILMKEDIHLRMVIQMMKTVMNLPTEEGHHLQEEVDPQEEEEVDLHLHLHQLDLQVDLQEEEEAVVDHHLHLNQEVTKDRYAKCVEDNI